MGLVVSGINVWEDGRDKVAEFVKNKGDGMSYNVAYTGKGGAFETEWLNLAGNSRHPARLRRQGRPDPPQDPPDDADRRGR